MSDTDGRRQKGDRARAQILAHSATIASTEGLEGLSIGRVAAQAGVAKGNIQVLFGDKEALQLATLEKAIELYQAAVVAPAMGQRSPLAKLLALVEGWYRYVDSRALPGGCFISAVSNEYRARPGRIRNRINDYRAAARDRFRTLIAEAKASGELRKDVDAEQLVFELIACQAAANVASFMDDRKEFARARETSFDRIRMAMTSPKKGGRHGGSAH